ncbi:MAG: ABC transporter permease [Candidatus Promineifilaceae bacterium]
MQNGRKPLPFSAQVIDLLLIELTNWRWSWRGMLTTATFAPLLSILALGVFARDTGPDALQYILTGNVVAALMFGIMGNVTNHFVFMRFMGGLDYFASLPISKYALILAAVLAFLLLSLPSVVVTIGVGALLLDIPLSINPLALLVIPASAVPLAGVGAILGVRARNPQEGNTLNLLLTLLLMGLGPVVIPPNRLPDWLVFTGRLSPATYAASALRQTLIGPVTGELLVDLLALVVFALVSFWLVGRFMDWRER